MQIQLNTNEAQDIIVNHAKRKFGLVESDEVSVEVNEDGSVVIYVNEEQHEESDNNTGTETSDAQPRQKRTRRTKAQIEADRLAEEAQRQLQDAQQQVENQATNDDTSKFTSGEVGNTAEETAQVDTAAVEQPVEQPAVEPEQAQTESNLTPVETETTQAAGETEPAPVRKSLFAGLKTPTNS